MICIRSRGIRWWRTHIHRDHVVLEEGRADGSLDLGVLKRSGRISAVVRTDQVATAADTHAVENPDVEQTATPIVLPAVDCR